jgi:hypothetical protein
MDGTVLGLLILLVLSVVGTRIFNLNPYFVIYVILSILIVFQGTSKLLPTGQGRAGIFGIGTSLILFFFGYRWFSTSSTKSKSWPPTINTCPDYLTFVPNISGSISNSRGGCVDMLGVTRGNLVKTLPSDITSGLSATSTKVFAYTSADVLATAPTDTATTQAICDACKTAGVTWEGVYDGDTCVGIATALSNQQAQSQCAQNTNS